MAMVEPEYGTDQDRFWAMLAEESDGHAQAFDDNTYGIVDETQGGVILYCHEDNVDFIINALRKVVL